MINLKNFCTLFLVLKLTFEAVLKIAPAKKISFRARVKIQKPGPLLNPKKYKKVKYDYHNNALRSFGA